MENSIISIWKITRTQPTHNSRGRTHGRNALDGRTCAEICFQSFGRFRPLQRKTNMEKPTRKIGTFPTEETSGRNARKFVSNSSEDSPTPQRKNHTYTRGRTIRNNLRYNIWKNTTRKFVPNLSEDCQTEETRETYALG